MNVSKRRFDVIKSIIIFFLNFFGYIEIKKGVITTPVIHAGFKPATPTSVVWYSIQLS